MRKEKVRRALPLFKKSDSGGEESLLETVAIEGASADEAIAQAEKRAEIETAVLKLPEREREVVTLRYFQELKLSEIAVVMKISVGTVKAHLSHGGAKLKKYLKEAGEHHE